MWALFPYMCDRCPDVLGHASNCKLVVVARTERQTPWLGGGGTYKLAGTKFNVGIDCSLRRN